MATDHTHPYSYSSEKKILDPAASARNAYDRHCTSNPYSTTEAQIAHHNMCNSLAYVMGNVSLTDAETKRLDAAIGASKERLANTPEAIAMAKKKLAELDANWEALNGKVKEYLSGSPSESSSNPSPGSFWQFRQSTSPNNTVDAKPSAHR